jgi:hypothetical protein
MPLIACSLSIGDHQHLAEKAAFGPYLAPLWNMDWYVYPKRPFAEPEQVLAYLSRYTDRVAILACPDRATEPRHAHGRTQFEGPCLLLTRNRKRTLEIRLRFGRVRLG